ncbi:MAG: D-alanyl-D-alanine carboxypeptidase family protein, partial [Bacillota bacterium]|nr:D-alanyl-D-alanine carboxypeptidase family protein [Bacillota bacterium]
MKRRFLPLLLLLGLILNPGRAAAQDPPPITADAFILMDAASGRVLHGGAIHQQRAPASTTKIMTAVLALELGDLQDMVLVSPEAAYTPGSGAGLRPGERYPLGELLEGLMLPSGNDAAVAIAQHLAGSVEAFAALMNEKAYWLGLKDTHFLNPHGLSHPQHLTSAYDLALLTRYALTLPTFQALVRKVQGEMAGFDAQGQPQCQVLFNTNRLLQERPWVTGVKTGTTTAAGHCLVSAAEKDGGRLIAVVLHSDDRWSDSLRLLEWGFENFRWLSLGKAGEWVARLPVREGRSPYVPVALAADMKMALRPDEERDLRRNLRLPQGLRAPVMAGEELGRAEIWA